MVQVYTYVPTTETVAVDKPLAPELKVTVPGPDFLLHAPTPLVGVLPPNEALISAPQIFWVDPTVATVGVAELVIVTVLSEAAQVPLLIVHLKT